MNRSLRAIAEEIKADWHTIHPVAKPFVDALATLESIDDMFHRDRAIAVVARLRGACGTWRGATARRIKLELDEMLRAAEARV